MPQLVKLLISNLCFNLNRAKLRTYTNFEIDFLMLITPDGDFRRKRANLRVFLSFACFNALQKCRCAYRIRGFIDVLANIGAV